MLEELRLGCCKDASLRRSSEWVDVVAEGKTDNDFQRMGMDRGKPCLGLAMLKLDDRG